MNGKWAEYQGKLVANRRLDSLLGVRGKTAYFLNKGEGQRRDRLIEVVTAGDESASVVEGWRQARDLSDDQLLRVYSMGESQVDNTKVSYAVVDLPEDDLAEILNRRQLDEQEARAMFIEVARGLDTLHRRGLAHGSVQPSAIFVVAGEVRLGIDTLAKAGKREKERDLRQFGTTLVQALTGRSDAVNQLHSPFKEIAAGCQSGSSKWTAARAYQSLAGRSVAPPRVPWTWVAVAAAAVVAILTFALMRGSASRTTETVKTIPTIVPPTQQQAEPPKPVQPPPLTGRAARLARQAEARNRKRTTEPPPPPPEKPKREKTTTAPPAARAPEGGPGNWVVVAATYAQHEAAQKRADALKKRFPSIEPHVYPPPGKGKYYFVVLAGHLSQNEAERLRRDLVDKGAPNDSYVTKLAEN